MNAFRLLCFLAILTHAPLATSAQVLVANISQGNEGSRPTSIRSSDGYAAWFARTSQGVTLYYLTPERTQPAALSGLDSLKVDGYEAPAALIDGVAYFHGYGNRTTVYYSADLRTGTLTKIAELPSPGNNAPDIYFAQLGDRLLFIHRDDQYRFLWYATDGTPGGTELLTQLPEDRFASRIHHLGDLVWLEYGFRHGGKTPYVVTDGTPQGTRTYEPPGELITYYDPIKLPFGTVVYGTADTGNTHYLLGADLSAGVPLRESLPSLPTGALRNLHLRGPHLYFTLHADGYHISLWQLDTTSRTATPVIDLNPRRDSVIITGLQALGDGWAYERYHQPTGRRSLHRTDGTPAGTYPLIDPAGDVTISRAWIPLGERYLFLAEDPQHGQELWRTDGTAAGTEMLVDLYPGRDGAGIKSPVRWGDRILFVATTPTYGEEVYTTDGTTSGTDVLIDAVVSETSSYPWPHAVVGGRLILRATTPCTGFELFVTEGTAGSTKLLADVVPGRESGHPLVLDDLLPDTGIVVYSNYMSSRILATEGTVEGTRQLDSLGRLTPDGSINQPGVLGGQLYFLAYVSGTGHGLFTYDIRADTFHLVKVIHPSSGFTTSGTTFVALNDSVLLFAATHPTMRHELWRTDGTEAGTYVIKDIRQVEESVTYHHVGLPLVHEGIAYFTAAENEEGIWRTDGTEEGTWQLLGGGLLGNPRYLFVYGGQVHFAAWTYKNWKLFTTAGERWDVRPSPITASRTFQSLAQFTTFGGKLAFAATTEDAGNELWATSAPDAAAVPLGDLYAGPENGYPRELFPLNDSTLLFSIFLPELGRELWSTDGTPEGTRLLADMNPGTASGDPANFFPFGDFVYFSANDGRNGHELWKYSPADLDNDGYVGTGNTGENDPSLPGVSCAAPQELTAMAEPIPAIRMSVYPNPASEFLRVRTDGGHDLQLGIFDASGREVARQTGNGPTHRFDLRRLPAGPYVLRVSATNGAEVASRQLSVVH